MSVLGPDDRAASQGGHPAGEFLVFPPPVRRHDHWRGAGVM